MRHWEDCSSAPHFHSTNKQRQQNVQNVTPVASENTFCRFDSDSDYLCARLQDSAESALMLIWMIWKTVKNGRSRRAQKTLKIFKKQLFTLNSFWFEGTSRSRSRCSVAQLISSQGLRSKPLSNTQHTEPRLSSAYTPDAAHKGVNMKATVYKHFHSLASQRPPKRVSAFRQLLPTYYYAKRTRLLKKKKKKICITYICFDNQKVVYLYR